LDTINDDGRSTTFARGHQSGDAYPGMLSAAMAAPRQLATLPQGPTRQLRAYRAMYEGRNARMFSPNTGIITWMSQPRPAELRLAALPLRPSNRNSSLYAVQSASEPIHIQFNEATGHIQIVNNTPVALPQSRRPHRGLQP